MLWFYKISEAEATSQSWDALRWKTRDYNYWACGSCGKRAQKTDWTLYEMTAK